MNIIGNRHRFEFEMALSFIIGAYEETRDDGTKLAVY